MAEYIPLTDLPALKDIDPMDLIRNDLPSVVWDFQLPPVVDAERLCINLNAIKRFQRVGAFTSSIVRSYDGETSTFTPGISGFNQDGSAIASKTGVKHTAKKSEGDTFDPLGVPSGVISSFGHPVSLHNLNKPELARIATDKISEKGMSRERAWSEVLDVGLRQSFRKAGKRHLVERSAQWLRVFDYCMFSSWIGASALLAAKGQVPLGPEIWVGAQIGITGLQAATNKRFFGSTMLSEKRWSMFYANHQSDRYALMWAMSGLSQLVGIRK